MLWSAELARSNEQQKMLRLLNVPISLHLLASMSYEYDSISWIHSWSNLISLQEGSGAPLLSQRVVRNLYRQVLALERQILEFETRSLSGEQGY